MIKKIECRFEELCREIYPDQESMRQKCSPKTCDHYCAFCEGEADAQEIMNDGGNENGTDR